jgi:hypothetical protein
MFAQNGFGGDQVANFYVTFYYQVVFYHLLQHIMHYGLHLKIEWCMPYIRFCCWDSLNLIVGNVKRITTS